MSQIQTHVTSVRRDIMSKHKELLNHETDITVNYTYYPGCPGFGGSLAHPPEPAEPPEVCIESVYTVVGNEPIVLEGDEKEKIIQEILNAN